MADAAEGPHALARWPGDLPRLAEHDGVLVPGTVPMLPGTPSPARRETRCHTGYPPASPSQARE